MPNYQGEYREEIAEVLRAAGGCQGFTLVDENGRQIAAVAARVVEPHPGQDVDINISCDKLGCECGRNSLFHTSFSHVRGRTKGADSNTYKRILDTNRRTLADLVGHVVPEEQLKQALREAYREVNKRLVAADAERDIMRLRGARPQSLDDAREKARALISV